MFSAECARVSDGTDVVLCHGLTTALRRYRGYFMMAVVRPRPAKLPQ